MKLKLLSYNIRFGGTGREARLAEVMQACETPQTASDIVPIMFPRPLDAHQISFAMGEALAHLHLLWFDGSLRRRLDDDGIVRFVRA